MAEVVGIYVTIKSTLHNYICKVVSLPNKLTKNTFSTTHSTIVNDSIGKHKTRTHLYL